ncbi:unnamed protein product [Trichobilharzia szidati]|nr:unnamed protein product [Trichobilharzia szidati]
MHMDSVCFYDHLVIIKNETHIRSKLAGKLSKGTSDTEYPSNGDVLEYLCKLLSEALKDRVSLVCPVSIPVQGKSDLQAIGLKYIGQITHALLTKGPQSNTPAGNEFRSFWGKKSELRRIDGDLCECVVWNSEVNVCMQIINYIFGMQFNVSSDRSRSNFWYHIVPNRLDSFITMHRLSTRYSLVTASSLRLIRAMDRLRILLRGLNEKLPLNITGILPLSSAFRDTAVFPPIVSVPVADQSVYCGRRDAKDRKYCTAKWIVKNVHFPVLPLYVVIHLEQSGRWPNDLEAFRHMKRLLIIRIHELLSPKGIPSHVTLDSMLDIFLDGLVFRVLIAQSKELNLIQKSTNSQVVKTNTTVNTHDDTISTEVMSTEAVNWIRLHQSLPTVVGTLAGISRTYAHVFPTACRLAKRWLSAHGSPVILCPYESELDGLHNSSDFFPQPDECSSAMSSYWYKEDMSKNDVNGRRISEVAVELLVLYACKLCDSVSVESNEANFINTAVIGSPVAGFLRFLDLLATHDWENVPILVDLNEGFSDMNKRRTALNSFHHTPRCNLPALVIYTPLDLTGTEWTEIGPSRSGLSELKVIAGQSRDLLRAMLVSGASVNDLIAIFRPVFKKTDIRFKFKANVTELRHLESLKGVLKDKNLSVLENRSSNEVPMELPAPGARYWPQLFCYDPLNWVVKLLQLRLGKYFEIFWDRHGGNWLALRWRQHYSQRRRQQQQQTQQQQELQSSSNMSSELIQPIVFSVDSLDGLTKHSESSSQLTDLVLVYNEKALIKLLTNWLGDFLRPVPVKNKKRHNGNNNKDENAPKCKRIKTEAESEPKNMKKKKKIKVKPPKKNKNKNKTKNKNNSKNV